MDSISCAVAVTVDKGGRTTKEKRAFSITGGMCPHCDGRGTVNNIDLSALCDEEKPINDGAEVVAARSTLTGEHLAAYVGS